MVPGIEPNRANTVAAQVRPNQFHKRAFAGTPVAGYSQRQWRASVRVAKKARNASRQRPKLQAVESKVLYWRVGRTDRLDACCCRSRISANRSPKTEARDNQRQPKPRRWI